MAEDVQEVYPGSAVHGDYSGGELKERDQVSDKMPSGCGEVALKTPVFGIICRGSKVWAEVVPDVEARTITSIIDNIDKRVRKVHESSPDAWKAYNGIATRGHIHRLERNVDGRYFIKKGRRIDGLEGFWGYLKRKLSSKGGIRKERLPLYLAEYVWRYNCRDMTVAKQAERLLNLLDKS